jgi:hypothetical protein
MMLHAQLAAIALAATTMAASGCGGSSKSDTATTAASTAAAPTPTTTAATITEAPTKTAPGKALTRTEFVVKANGICAHVTKQVNAMSPKSSSELANSLQQSVVYHQTEISELSKLAPPASMSREWKQFLTSLGKSTEDTAKAAGYMQTKGFATTNRLLVEIKNINEQVRHAATRSGIKMCATSS